MSELAKVQLKKTKLGFYENNLKSNRFNLVKFESFIFSIFLLIFPKSKTKELWDKIVHHWIYSYLPAIS